MYSITSMLRLVAFLFCGFIAVGGCRPKSTLELNQQDDELSEAKQTVVASENWEDLTPSSTDDSSKPPSGSSTPLRVEGFQSMPQVAGFAEASEGNSYLVVQTSIPGNMVWTPSSGGFFSGPKSARLLADQLEIPSVATKLSDSEKFSKSQKTAFLPEPPVENEVVLFVFLVAADDLKKVMRFQYGEEPSVELATGVDLTSESN